MDCRFKYFCCCHVCCPKRDIFSVNPEEHKKQLLNDECGICLEILNGSPCIKTKNCNHIFHKYCYQEYLKNIKNNILFGCPLCNSSQEELNLYIRESI